MGELKIEFEVGVAADQHGDRDVHAPDCLHYEVVYTAPRLGQFDRWLCAAACPLKAALERLEEPHRADNPPPAGPTAARRGPNRRAA